MYNYRLKLWQFDEGGAGAAAEGASAGGNEAATTEPQDPSLARKARIKAMFDKASGIETASRSAETDTQGSAEEVTETAEQQTEQPKTPTPEERKAEFKRLIKGDYKDLYQEEMNIALDRRFRAGKAANDQITAMQPIIQMVAERYGVDAKDLAAVSKALENDNAAYETEAATKGMSVEQLKEVKRLQRENEQYRQASERIPSTVAFCTFCAVYCIAPPTISSMWITL